MRPDDARDLELLARWRAGDTRAGSQLLKRHFATLHRFFSSKAHDHVEDLIQQTFEACVHARDSFRGDASFRAYLFGLARGQLHEYLRKHRRRASIDFTTTSVMDMRLSPSGALAQHEQGRLLSSALQRVPIDQQIALELKYWEDLSAPEIAQVLGIPENTVYSRLNRAKEHVRKAIEQLSDQAELREQALRLLSPES